MTSPAYSELPQELLLDVDPMRPTTTKYKRFPHQWTVQEHLIIKSTSSLRPDHMHTQALQQQTNKLICATFPPAPSEPGEGEG